jgi:hypothetical protein
METGKNLSSFSATFAFLLATLYTAAARGTIYVDVDAGRRPR